MSEVVVLSLILSGAPSSVIVWFLVTHQGNTALLKEISQRAFLSLAL